MALINVKFDAELPGGVDAANARLYLWLLAPDAGDVGVVTGSKVVAFKGAYRLDATGDLTLALRPNVVGSPANPDAITLPIGTKYLARIEQGQARLELIFEVPATANGASPWPVGDILSDAPGTLVSPALQLHLDDTVAAHAATAISFAPTGSLAATTVQAMGAELDGDIVAETAARIADVNAEEAARIAADGALQVEIDAEEAARIAHGALTNNPHAVTKTQVGLGSVDDVQQQPLDADLTTIAGLDSAQSGVVASDGAGWFRKTYAAIKTTLALVKADVGLSNVDNTSDAAKPVSTAQQTALDLKANDNLVVKLAGSQTITGAKTHEGAAVGTVMEAYKVTGDTVDRLSIKANGNIDFSPGTTGVDMTFARGGGPGSASWIITLANIQIDNNKSVMAKDNGGSYRRTFFLDTANNYGARNEALSGSAFYGCSEAGNTTGTVKIQLAAAVVTEVLNGGDLALLIVGKTLKIKEGTNAKMGVATLVAGTVTVSTTAVTANSRIFLTINTAGGTVGAVHVSARTAATSFAITSTSGSDTSTVAWLLLEPA